MRQHTQTKNQDDAIVNDLLDALYTEDGLEPDANLASEMHAWLEDAANKPYSTSNSQVQSFIYYFTSFMENTFKLPAGKNMILGSMAAVLAIGVVAGGLIYSTSGNSTGELTLAEQQRILAEIQAANGGNIRDLAAAPTIATGDAAMNPESSKLSMLAFDGYHKSTSTTTYGPKADFCANSYRGYPVDSFTSTWSSLYKNNTYYSESITLDADGNLLDYNVNNKDGNFQYRGGKYAVKLIGGYNGAIPFAAMEKLGDADTSSSPTTEMLRMDSAEDTTSNNSAVVSKDIDLAPEYDSGKLVGQETIDGKEYYITEYVYDYYCDSVPNQKVVSRSWAQKDSYLNAIQEEYLNSVSANNLIARYTYAEENKKANQVDETALFTNDYASVTTRTIDTAEYVQGSDKYNAALATYLNSNNIAILNPVDTKLKPEMIGSDQLKFPNVDAYMADRDFYRSDAVGNALYEQNQSYFDYTIDYSQFPEANYTHSRYTENGSNYFYIYTQVYKQGVKAVEAKIVESKVPGEAVTITIDGQEITGKLFKSNEIYRTEPGRGVDDLKTAPAGTTGGGSAGSEGTGSTDPDGTDTDLIPEKPEGSNGSDPVAEPSPAPDVIANYHDWVIIFAYGNHTYTLNMNFTGNVNAGKSKLQFTKVSDVSAYVKAANPEPQNPVIAF